MKYIVLIFLLSCVLLVHAQMDYSTKVLKEVIAALDVILNRMGRTCPAPVPSLTVTRPILPWRGDD